MSATKLKRSSMLKGPVWIIHKYSTTRRYPRHIGLGKALVQKGISTTIICSVSNSVVPNETPVFKGWKKIEDHEGLKVIWLNGPRISENGFKRILSWFWFEIKVLITFWFSKQKPESILSSSLSLLSVWSGWMLSRRHKARFNFEVRDIWPLSLIALGGYSAKNPLVKFLSFTEKFGYCKANCIVGTMPNLAGHVRKLNSNWANKVICVPQGVDTTVFNEQSVQLPEDFVDQYLPKDKFIITYAGTLNANNPIDTLLNAARELEADYPELHFVILGKGVNREKYIESCKDLSNIVFPPMIPKEQMAHFLSYVTIGYDAVSSIIAEYGLSRNKWIDYMYNQCIIVCSYDGFQSMLNEAKSGFFVEHDNVKALKCKLIEIFEMPRVDRAEMALRAKRYIENKRSFETLSDLYVDHL